MRPQALQTKAPSAPSSRALGQLQRKCACGNQTHGDEECQACQQKRLSLQRKRSHQAEPGEIPAIVHEVVQSPGEPLDSKTRAFFEPRFNHDFSRVRVHTDTRAANSAEAVNALAYTVGQNIAFASQQYAPGSPAGQHLLAHELTHVLQQNTSSAQVNGIDHPQSSLEQEATRTAEHIVAGPNTIPPIAQSATPVLQRKASEFPGFSQGVYNTCGAASVVSALMIWDKEKKDPAAPNNLLVTACNILLIHLDDHKSSLIAQWNKINFRGQGDGESLYNELFSNLTRIRDAARLPGSKISEDQYQTLGLCLYSLYFGGTGGLSTEEIHNLLTQLGLQSGSSEGVKTFEQIFSSSVLQSLKPGQITQVTWWVRTGQPDAQGKVPLGRHAFLMGRFGRGSWFLSDQGTNPATELEADTLEGLKLAINLAVSKGYWLHTGEIQTNLLISTWGGVRLLGDQGGMEKQARDLIIVPGEFLAQIDAGYTTLGDNLNAWDLLARSYSLEEAKKAFETSGSGHGGVIVENPQGLFHTYKTNPVREPNLGETQIDEDDSKGGKLGKPKRFYQAWLRLCTTSKCSPSWFRVY